MSVDDIAVLVAAFGHAASIMEAAGTDGVEVHAAHGYLIAQFLSRSTNHRSDAYGGSVQGRALFLAQIVAEIRRRCSPGFVVGARISAVEEVPDGVTMPETTQMVTWLQDESPLDYLSVTLGVKGAYVRDTSTPEGVAAPLAAELKRHVDLPIIVAQRIRTPAQANEIIERGDADFVAMGRALIADPEWPTKAQDGAARRIRPCIGIVQDCRSSPGGVTCAVNADAGHELARRRAPNLPASRGGRVTVIGGGPAGLEAARVAAEHGMTVTLFERDTVLGGQLTTAAADPTRAELNDFVRYLTDEVAALGVTVHLGTAATRTTVEATAPDLLVVATGARSLPPGYPIDATMPSMDVREALRNPPTGRRTAAVIDDGSGFWPAISAVNILQRTGSSVVLITPAPTATASIPTESRATAATVLTRSAGVVVLCNREVLLVGAEHVHVLHRETGITEQIEVDLVVFIAGSAPEDTPVPLGEGIASAVVKIGDCAAPRRLTHAIRDANLAVTQYRNGSLSGSDALLS